MSGEYLGGYMPRKNNPREETVTNGLRMDDLYLGLTKQQRAASFKHKAPRQF